MVYFFALALGLFQYVLAASDPRIAYEIPKDDQVLSVLGAATQSELPPTFKALIWNAYKGEKESWEYDFLTVTPGKDLVLIQEAMIDNWMPKLFTSIAGFGWNFATSFKFNDGRETGVSSGSAVEPLEVFFMRSPTGEPVLNTPKVAAGTIYRVANMSRRLLVLNIHALNFVANSAFEDQINLVLQRIGQHDGPVLFAGDFNTWNWLRLQFLKEAAAKVGLSLVDIENEPAALVLDHVLVRGLQVIKARRLNSIKGSDHAPIEVELTTLLTH